jgi:NmrA-like family.
VLRPVFFMQNLAANREDVFEDGTLALALAEGVPLQMVDVDDLGALVTRVVEDPERYVGETTEVASDELTLRAAATRVADVTGREVRAHHLDPAVLEEAMGEVGEEYRVMFEWFNEFGYESPIDELQTDHDLDLTRLEEYLQRAGWDEAPAATEA